MTERFDLEKWWVGYGATLEVRWLYRLAKIVARPIGEVKRG